MKNTFSLPRVALVALAFGTASVTATFAQTTTTPPSTTSSPACTGGGGFHHHKSVLTDAERAQLKKDHDAVIAANGTFQTTQAGLKQQLKTLKGEGASATPADWQAFHQQKKAFHKDVKAAMVALDPSVAPILTKLESAHKGWHHHSDGTSSST